MDEKQVEEAKRVAYEMHHANPNYNCAQCVACALAAQAGVGEDEAFRATEGFGGGMGGFDQVCGAISGAIYLAGVTGSAGIEERTTKKATYAKSAAVVQRFQGAFGSVLCCDLKCPDPAKTVDVCDRYIYEGIEAAAAFL